MNTLKSASVKFSLPIYYGLTIFLSAFLLFQIEPLISKYILPWFGGGTAVWTTAMMFFQILLLAGYTYAHLISKFHYKKQARIHLLILGITLLWLIAMSFFWQTPITPGPDWKPNYSSFPAGQVLWILLASVGLPFFILSTTSSLVQSWFSHIRHQESPYSFYILSNAASLLALLSYPMLFEPNFSTKQQALFWTIAFIVFLALVGGCALILFRSRNAAQQGDLSIDKPLLTVPLDDQQSSPLDPVHSFPPSRKKYLFWISLAACASIMLLATTNQICQDIASIPFLWVLPLSLYLLSFVVAFNDYQRRIRSLYVILMVAGLFLGLWNLANGSRMTVFFLVGSNSALLFIVCLLCHSELYINRPHPRYLTSFYLMLSVGGALGGIFVNLIAPLIFKDFWEYNLALVFCAVIAVVMVYQSRGSWLYRMRIPIAVTSISLSIFIVMLPVLWITKSVDMSRNFYGVLKIRQMQSSGIQGFDMQHGAVVHGSQASEKPYNLLPTRYYTESSGIGLAIKNYRNRLEGKPITIGVMGLGTGTLTAYAQPGDHIRFYEIDAKVIRAARDTRFFTYLRDAQGMVDIVEGDARLSIDRELKENQTRIFDILVLDAFSGDSIPTHLVSREAIGIYASHLKENGVLAVNVSNRYIDMEPVFASVSQYYGLEGAYIESGSSDFLGAVSSWILLTYDKGFFHIPAIAAVARPLALRPGFRIWTDDYSNLFQVLR